MCFSILATRNFCQRCNALYYRRHFRRDNKSNIKISFFDTPFTKAGKEAVKDVNKEKNDGEMKCENCDQAVKNAKQHTKGKTPPNDEAHVDHIDPVSNGGSGTPNNGQVLCRGCNLGKGSNPMAPPPPPTAPSPFSFY